MMNLISNRRLFVKLWGSLLSLTLLATTVPAVAADMAADAFVKQLSDEVVETIKGDKSLQASNMTKLKLWLTLK